MNERSGLMPVLGMAFVGLTMLLCYSILPYIGGAVLIFFDYAAYGFRWLDIKSPGAAWMPLGAAVGALIGLISALRRVGVTTATRNIAIWGAAGFASLYVLSLLYCHVMKPAYTSTPNPPPTSATTTPQLTTEQ